MEFTIDDAHICSLTIRKEWGMFDHVPEDELTQEQLIKILTGADRCSSVSTADHPEFTKLRDNLEQQGYIVTTRNSWNGDRVIKPFTLNGIKFKKGYRFLCSAAMRVGMDFAKKSGRPYNPGI